MKQNSLIVLRPVCFFIFMILVVLSLAGLLITIWFNKVATVEKEVKLIAHNIHQHFISEIHNAAAFFFPNNASAINFARILGFSLDNNNNLPFPNIESKVAPALFQAFSTIPYLSQISYIGLNGLLFAYGKDEDEPYALYSNSTFPARKDAEEKYTWYLQPANRDTGKLYGEATKFPAPALVKASWLQGALNSTNGYASVGTGWRNLPQDVLLLNTIRLDGNGVISLGFRMKPLIDFLVAQMGYHDGSMYLVTTDWDLAIQGLPNSRVILDGGDQVLFQLSSRDGGQLQTVGNISCNGELSDHILSIGGKKSMINCSPAEIAGLSFVFVLVVARDEYSSLVHKKILLALALLMLLVGALVILICIFVSLIVEAARREMFLCGALINQMESTQQSERKSMNKSLAFASASHDIRASLAGISGLIEVCRSEVTKRDPCRSEVVENLLQMEACTRDLLGILNCVLDTSKIEAGKMQLEEQAFDVEQLLEDVVDLYHPVGMKKGVDVILDPCDGSVSRCCWAKGDRTKLKQILSNLLSNAVKFTTEGHVSVGAWARKPCLKNEMLGSTQTSCLFKFHRAKAESESFHGDPNRMDFTFEVNDTGKGIPKEKRKSVFENYIQVRETALGQQGTGLGLGIVQSLVRLMGGEIGIVDKEVGERGSCFRFNVLLTGSLSAADFWLPNKAHSSRVVLLLKSAQRSNVLQAFMQRLGIKVHAVKQHQQLRPTLNKIKQKMNLSSHSSSSSRSVPLSSLDGIDQNKQSGLVLMVVDTCVGPFSEMSGAIADFRRDLSSCCYTRVVWLDSATAEFDVDELAAPDLVISKPFHGSRLYQTIALLPEFGGVPPRRGGAAEREEEEVGKPLMGKKILVVDDDPVGRKIATFVASQLGAEPFCCENGAAACRLVCESLRGGESARFDCILMDCEMPVMDGSEATARIREVEGGYGVRTAMVALSAHSKGEEVEKMMEAGVDAYITKPLNTHNLLTALSPLITKI
ncbi:histidine kinase CKI1-like [Salvia miltiorrhiza]|uniref:histidine kinase CKI1-like n=1 Tax=Salvia miltiorrhiza TaxID=226208 RepID=UPI0025AD8D6C|nr:histidine kinase CKI1-like [Salvia miltiorrhiza]XP_057789987.1 histidine kinase CKI1-like [Salvia miltiorrhiza]XP_057789988.1 histidine kinase CKI1-like [Salvia miltiorrhiza]